MQQPDAWRDDSGPRLVVSVHDVAPSTLPGVRWLLRRLDDAGVTPRVLKVIPNEGGSRPIGQDPELLALLHGEVAGGSEIVLHGYSHLALGRSHSHVVDRMRARLFARSAAEFASLTPVEAAERVEAGRAALARVGLEAVGFCAPGWLAGPRLADVLRVAGMRYLVSFAFLVDLQGTQSRFVPGCGYMGADSVQEGLVAAAGGYLLALGRAFPVVRLFLHPQGAPASRPCARTLVALERLLQRRRPATYAELLGA